MQPSRPVRPSDVVELGRKNASSLVLFLIVAVLLGGGHIFGAIRNAVVEIVALALLLRLTWQAQSRRPLPREASAPLVFFLAVLSLLLVQMLPILPAPLAGHEVADATIALTAPHATWHSISLDPSATARFAMSLLVPLVACLLTIRANNRQRLVAVRAIAVLAAISALLGMVQLSLGSPAWLSPFGMGDENIADGLFVNRNHQAMFLLCGLIATSLWIALDERSSPSPLRLRVHHLRIHLAWLLMPLLALMVVAAGSKAGIGLLAIVLPAAVLVALPAARERTAGIGRWLGPLAVVAAIGAVIFLVIPSPITDRLRTQQVLHGDARLEFLPDLIVLMRQLWPLGSGAGTFVPVYKMIEDLDKLGSAYLNHAHNDYIEWVIETGLPGLILLAAGVLLILLQMVAIVRSRRSPGRIVAALGGTGMIIVLALHSVVDYPLRTDALAAVLGVALGLLFAPPLDQTPPPGPPPARRSLVKSPVLIGLALLGIVGAGQMMRLRLGEVAAGDANAGLAQAIGSNDGFARAYVAEAKLAGGDDAGARDDALAAIRTAPLAVVAVRTLAIADARLGDFGRSREAWRAATLLGWRDVPTQFWAMRQALRDGQAEIAGMRADAIMRQGTTFEPTYDVMRAQMLDPKLRAAIIPRMRLEPAWRERFLHPGRLWTGPELAAFQPLIEQLRRGAAPPSRIEARDVILTLLDQRRWAEAIALDAPFAAQRRPDPGSLLDDGGFTKPELRYNEDASPFEWYRAPTASLDPTGQTMVVATDGKQGDLAVHRSAALAPGRYRLSFKTRGPATSPAVLGIRVLCPDKLVAGTSPVDPLPNDHDFIVRQFDVVIPATCPVATIGIGAQPGGDPAEAEFDDIRLWPIAPGVATAR